MRLSKHASVRMQQRGIPLLVVDLLRDYGTVERAGDGTSKHYFDKAARRRVKAYAGPLVGFIEQYMNCYAVISDEDIVVTVAPRTDRIRH